jgi:hypothetical protein
VRNDLSAAAAEASLRGLGALKLALAEEQSTERIQAAIVLLATGNPYKFDYYAELAEADWRDAWCSAASETRIGRPARLDDELGPAS